MFDFEAYWNNSEATPATATSPAFPMTIAACCVSTKEQWGEFSRQYVRQVRAVQLFYAQGGSVISDYETDWGVSRK
jgi:hypothetical protein